MKYPLEKFKATSEKAKAKMTGVKPGSLMGEISRVTLMTVGGITLSAIVLGAGIVALSEDAHALSFGHKHGFDDGATLEQATKRASSRFAKMDDNNDGKLSDDELTFKKRWGHDDDDDDHDDARQGFIQQMIDLVDANSDGEITEAEFIDYATTRFNEIDTDGDGVISEAEEEVAEEAQRAERKRLMFQMMDTDGDGAISQEEFEAGQSRYAKHGKRGGHRSHHGRYAKHGKRGGHRSHHVNYDH